MRDCLHILMQLAEQDYADLMGELYMSLEIGSKDMGQFFTPYQISRLMAMLTIDRPSLERAAAQNNFIEFNEPTCGAGGMIIAAAEAIRTLGFDPARHMRVTAQRSEEHTSELQSLMRISYAVFCLKNKN